MAVLIKYGQDIVWGTTSAGALATLGKILGVNKKKTGKVFEQPDENDETYAVVFHDDVFEGSVDVMAKPDATLPDRGDEVTIAGVAFLVLDVDEVWANNDAKKIRLDIKRWVAAAGA